MCNSNNVKYSYKNEGLGFSFTFERNETNLLHHNDRTNDRINDRLTESEKEIYDYILENNTIKNTAKLAEKLNKSVITIQRGLKKLVDLGLVERVGSNKTGFWRIK